MFDDNPIITKRFGGEYSTVILPDGQTVETCWFGKDGSSEVIGRTIFSKRTLANKHIEAFEQEGWS